MLLAVLVFQIICWFWSQLQMTRNSLIFSQYSIISEKRMNSSMNIQFFQEKMMPDAPSSLFLSVLFSRGRMAVPDVVKIYIPICFSGVLRCSSWAALRVWMVFLLMSQDSELHIMLVILFYIHNRNSYNINWFYVIIFILWTTVKVGLLSIFIL